MFYGCKKLANMQLPPNCEILNHGSFVDTHSLLKLELPDSVKTIAQYHPTYFKVFSMSGLKEKKINPTSQLKTIGSDCFSNSHLEYFYFPEFCTDVTFSAFQGCPIIEFTFHKNNKKFKTDGTSVFTGNNNETLLYVSSGLTGTYTVPSFVTILDFSSIRGGRLTKCIIGSQVTSIGTWVLAEGGLTEFEFPPQITAVVEAMFYDCQYLTTVKFTESITQIQGSAFYHCIALTNIVLPSKLKSIGRYAFARCLSLKTLTLPAGCDDIGDGVFNEISITINSLNPDIQIDDYIMYQNDHQTVKAYLG